MSDYFTGSIVCNPVWLSVCRVKSSWFHPNLEWFKDLFVPGRYLFLNVEKVKG
jgi:hypothetical protein